MSRLASIDRWDYLMLLAVLAGAAVRFYAAWTMQYLDFRDSAVVMLMAKHMAEFLHIPVFYYGQPYMGSVEPMFSTLFCWLMGVTPFATACGTAFLGSLVPLLVALMARDAGGPRAGFFAALYLVASSDALLYLSGHPRGGYMTLLVFGLLTLWLATHYVARAAAGEPHAARWLAAAGFFAGLGWWNNQMVVVYFAAAGLLGLLVCRDVFRRGAVWWAVAAFVLGSLPWWWWNVQHEWATFAFTASFRELDVRTGFRFFLLESVSALGYKPWPEPLNVARVLLLATVSGLAVAALVRAAKRDGWRSLPFLSIAAALLVVLAMMAVYSTSHFSNIRTPRYVIPIVPAFAVIVGVGLGRLAGQSRRALVVALLLAAALLPPTLYRLPKWAERVPGDRERWNGANALADFLVEHGDGVAAGDFLLYWVNFANLERGLVVNAPDDSYAPYSRKFALAERQIFINDFKGVERFLAGTGAAFQRARVGAFRITHGIRPPSVAWDAVPGEMIASVAADGRDARPVLADGHLDTALDATIEADDRLQVQWTFNEPRPVCGLVVMNPRKLGWRDYRVEGRGVDGTWVELQEPTAFTGYFWSGDRIYHEGVGFLQECRFEPPPGGVTAIRFIGVGADRHRVVIPEMWPIEQRDRDVSPARAEAVAEWTARLRSSPSGRLYAPRWLAEALYEPLATSMVINAASYMGRSVQALPKPDRADATYIVLDRPTALVVDARDAARTRRLLESRGLTFTDSARGGLHLFEVAPVDLADDLESVVPLYWTERGLFASDGKHDRLARAASLYEAARTERDAARRLRLLERIVELAPEFREASEEYVAARRAAGDTTGADEAARRLERYWKPDIEADARFRDRIRLAGFHIEPREVRPGGEVTITYLWDCPPKARVDKWSVFVHVRSGERMVLQDDHNLVDMAPRDEVRRPLFARLFNARRTVRIPEDTPSGELELSMGLVHPLTGEISSVDSPLETRWRAVVVPGAIRVVE